MVNHDADSVGKSATYLVSGGASHLGAAIVRQISSAGHHVIIGDTDESAAAKIADELDGTRAPDLVRSLLAQQTDSVKQAKCPIPH